MQHLQVVVLPKQRVAGSNPVSRSRYDSCSSGSGFRRSFSGGLWLRPIWARPSPAISDTNLGPYTWLEEGPNGPITSS